MDKKTKARSKLVLVWCSSRQSTEAIGTTLLECIRQPPPGDTHITPINIHSKELNIPMTTLSGEKAGMWALKTHL